MNIFDYVATYGIYSFSTMPFNEVDNAALTMLTYLTWDNVVTRTPKPLSAIAEKYFSTYEKDPGIMEESSKSQRRMLLALMANSKRYKNIFVYDYEKKFSVENAEQFAAVTFQIGLFEYFVAFQGTDGSLVGWREDFDMTYIHPVPAQADAAAYLQKELKRRGKFRVGGHSKGGNLAVYAGIEAEDERITHIYSNDGPGLWKEFAESEKFQRQKHKIIHIMPESTVIGLIMYMGDCPSIIVDTTVEQEDLQHNALVWKVEKDHFVRLDSISEFSVMFKNSITTWFLSLTAEEQKAALDMVGEVTEQLDIKTFDELLVRKNEAIGALFKAFRSYDKQTRHSIYANLGDLVKLGGSSIFEGYRYRRNRNKEKEEVEKADSQQEILIEEQKNPA